VPDPTLMIIAAAATAGWILACLTVVAGCRVAAEADRDMAAEDEAVAMAGPMGWLCSEALAGEHVAHGPQQDLDVLPERPVRHVEIVHRAHLA